MRDLLGVTRPSLMSMVRPFRSGSWRRRCSAVVSPANRSKPGLIEIASEGALFTFPLFPVRPRICDILLPLLPSAHETSAGQASRVLLIVAQLAGEPEPPAWDHRLRMLEKCPWSEIRLPSLRERCESIPELARRHLAWIRGAMGADPVEIDASACEFLQAQTWPGNLHQFANVVERAGLLSETRVLTAEEFKHS